MQVAATESQQLCFRAAYGSTALPVLDHGFELLALNRIEAHTESANAASIRMLRRLGFWQEGTFHDRFFDNGSYHDVALFVLLAKDTRR